MKFRETQIITLANQKGGCGKTTSSISIAAAFNRLGYSATIVDLDPQCNASQSFGVEPSDLYDQEKMTVLDAMLYKRSCSEIMMGFPEERFNHRLFLIPGNPQLGELGQHLELEHITQNKFSKNPVSSDKAKLEHHSRLKESLKSLRGQVDVIIIDTPPNLGFLMTSALVAADWFIIPVFPSKFDLNGLAKLTVSINEIRDLQNENLKLAGILVGNFAKGIKLDAQVYKFLQDKFGPNTVFETTISRAKNMREMVFYNQTIFEFAETAEQAEDFLTLAKEMINRAMKGQSTTRPLPDLQSVVETATTSEAKLDLSGLENTQPVTEEIPEAANG